MTAAAWQAARGEKPGKRLKLNNPDSTYYRNITTPATVTEIFTSVRPMGGTPTGQRLNQILRPYLHEY